MIIAMSLILFAACPKHIDLSSEDRSTIKKVSINKEIAMPEDMYYFGPGDFGYTGGALGYLLAQAIYSAVVDVPEDLKGKPKEVFMLIMTNHNINVDEILFESFSKNLAKSNYFG